MRRPPAVLDPLIVGVLAATLSLCGAGRPSFWYDEAATISASYSRSLPQLWQMLSNVDAVHGLYYLLMHGWFQIFPPTEFWSRAPSGLAVAGAAAGLVVLGRQFSSRTVAVSSGVVCALLPRSTWAGIEARPYALSMLAAVWLTVLFVHATRRDNAWLWLSYGIVVATSGDDTATSTEEHGDQSDGRDDDADPRLVASERVNRVTHRRQHERSDPEDHQDHAERDHRQTSPCMVSRPPHPACHAAGRARTYMRKTPKRVASIGALSAALIPMASARRVSSGSITPSSQSRAVE